MKKIALWIAAQFYAACLLAQGHVVTDSLEHLLQAAQTDTAKALLCYQLGDEWSLQDSAKALKYLQKGMQLSKKYPFYQGIGNFYLGRICMDYDRTRAIEAFNRALHFFEPFHTQNAYLYQSRSWSNKAAIAQWNSDSRQYIELTLTKVIPLAEKAGDSSRIADGYTNVAMAFMNFGDYPKAIDYFNRSVAIFRRLAPTDLRLADNYANLAKIYLLDNHLSVAKGYLDHAFSIIKKYPQSLYAPYYYSIESMYYRKREDWDKAEGSIHKGLAIAEALKSRRDIGPLLQQQAKLYDTRHNYPALKAVLVKMLDGGYVATNNDREQHYRALAFADSILGNMNAAYDWIIRYSSLADSINKEETRLKITDLEARYNYTQKEKELLIAKTKARNQRLIMWLSLSGLLIAIAFFSILYRSRRTKAKQEIQSLQQQQQIAVAQALLAGEERERTRIARDLHDGLGGMLASVKINLTQALPENVPAGVGRAIGQLDNSVMELRRIARNMMPEALLRSGLETALTELCELTENSKLQIYSTFMNLRGNLSISVQLIIYRITQELLANIVKHAAATEVFFQCSQDENTFYLTIEDNGRGFFQPEQQPGKGLGLDNIKTRVTFLKGTMNLTGRRGGGTVINIELRTTEG